MNAPKVNVLAVMNDCRNDLDAARMGVAARELEKARAAVAELIEATDCLTDAIANDRGYREDVLKGLRPLERDSFVFALYRTRAALARIGGAI